MNPYFPGACEPWIPRLIDIEKRKADGEPGYADIGFDALDIPASLTNIDARKSDLSVRFLERYAERMINSETLERWQVRLQNRFDEIGDRYERAYQLYADNGAAMMDDILPGWQETMDRTDANSGTDTSTRTGNETFEPTGTEQVASSGTDTDTKRVADTPDATVNASDMYANRREVDSLSHGKTDTRSFTNRKDTRTYNSVADALVHGKQTDIDWTLTHLETGSEIIDAVNEAIQKWRDLDTEFIKEFENLFLNVFWY